MIAHIGGPYWVAKDRSWTIPKGLREPDETDLLAVAEREFTEEMGTPPPPGDTHELGSVLSGNKKIIIFARNGDFDAASMTSNTFSMEWPPHSGRMQDFPEVDQADWCNLITAESKLVTAQIPFLSRLEAALAQA